jgi:hypothetical protein
MAGQDRDIGIDQGKHQVDPFVLADLGQDARVIGRIDARDNVAAIDDSESRCQRIDVHTDDTPRQVERLIRSTKRLDQLDATSNACKENVH